MPYIYLMAPNATTVSLVTARESIVRDWLDEWLPQFTGWAGTGETSCTIRVQPIGTPPDRAGEDWAVDWPADSRVTGASYPFRATTGDEGMAELAQLREILEATTEYLRAGGHPSWECPAMSTAEIQANAPHPCLASFMATYTTGPGGRSVQTADDVQGAIRKLGALTRRVPE